VFATNAPGELRLTWRWQPAMTAADHQ